ncbi:MAG: hypothetical protein H0V52_00840 [Acidimicrobiia bacterium]|nr:hypothetical protein [Acidimicrobiia bacterium]
MVDDVGRRMLFGTLESSLGREAAIKMMELMPEVEWTDLARRSDVEGMGLALRADMADLRGELRGDMAKINERLSLSDGRMVGFEGRLVGFGDRLDGFEGRLVGLGDRLSGEIAEVKGDMRAMGARIALANMAGSATIAGLVLAAIKLF